MQTMPAGVRNLFRAALVIFVITVVIGILNGLDIWEPPRNTLLTHVHAGTLGWITLSVFGGAIWMFGSPDDKSTNTLANLSIAAMTVYVLAFWSVDLTTSSIQRPIGGTLAFIAIVWMFVGPSAPIGGGCGTFPNTGWPCHSFSCSSGPSLECSSGFSWPRSRSSPLKMQAHSVRPIPPPWWLVT